MSMRRSLIILAGVILITAGLVGHFYFIDGELPESGDYSVDIAQLRSLAVAGGEDRPSSVEVEMFASDEIPRMGAIAGLDRSPHIMARTAFRLRSDWGDTVIDAGMDRHVADKFNSGKIGFSETSISRVAQAMRSARIVAVTHEHPDHLGLLPRLDFLPELIPALRLTDIQIAATSIYTDDGKVPEVLADIEPIDIAKPQVISPGVVMIGAPGHTPGSVMFFVSMANGEEFFFVGDVIWTLGNLTEKRGRSRFVQQFMMQTAEERGAVQDQIAWLAELKENEPTIQIIPSHDAELITELINSGTVTLTFGGSAEGDGPS